MKNKYLITLTPLGNYFFGGELGFGDLNTELPKKENERKINYLVEGTQFPQQTTLLGMLRYELLRNKGWLSPNHKTNDAIDLVGIKGFDSNQTDSFGIIDNLSPVFITNSNQAFIPNRLLSQNGNEPGKNQLVYANTSIMNGNGSHLTNYDAKHPIDDEYANPKNLSVKQSEEIFQIATQIGIKKNYTGSTDENAFFKQTFNRLKKGFSFAFYVQFNEIPDFEQGVIFMGGDQSLFKFEIAVPIEKSLFDEIETENSDLINNSNETDSFEIILLSDCKVSNVIFEYCSHSINEIRVFRHILVAENNTGFAHINKTNGIFKRENKLELLARNSVLFVEGLEKLKEVVDLINSEIAFKNIGYNFIKIIKK
jgi:CRISPR-associated protein Cmr3